MWNYIWPLFLVVGSNVIYHITMKEAPGISPFLSLVVTYTIGALFSLLLYFIIPASGESSSQGIFQELRGLNWASFLLGMAIVGLEAGYIYLYRAGWKISLGPVVCNTAAAVLLMSAGFLLYRETLTPRQIIGGLVCLAGMFVMNA